MHHLVTLSADEALVLLDWLHRHEDSDDLPVDDAQQRVLWNLAASLERVVAEAFDPDYTNLLTAAKARLTAE